MINITKNLFLFFTLFLFNSGYGAESLFLGKGEVVIDEDFSDDSIDVKMWPLAKKRPAGQKAENGFYHYDFSQRSKKSGRIGLGHYLSEPIGDLIFEFKYMTTNGFKSLNLGFNDKHGHCLVIRLEKHKMYSWKFKEKNKPSEFQDITGAKLRDGEEYTVTVEISGPNVFVHLDDKHFLIGQNERFKNPKTKIFFGFMGGKGKVDSVKVWKGKTRANPDIPKWTAKKTQRYPYNL